MTVRASNTVSIICVHVGGNGLLPNSSHALWPGADWHLVDYDLGKGGIYKEDTLGFVEVLQL